MARRIHHFVLTLDWDPELKRWKLTYVVQVGRGVASHWRWIESRASVDALTASQLADVVKQELEQRLF